MAYPKAKTPSYILTLPLRYEPWQRDYLDKMFRVCGNMCNNLIADRKKALAQMLRTKEWKTIQLMIDDASRNLKELRKVPAKQRTPAEEGKITSVVEYRKSLYDIRNSIKAKWGLTKFSFQERMKKYRSHHAALVNSMVTQKLADKVWQKFDAYLRNKGNEIRFIPWTEFFSLEGKNNQTGIIFRDGLLYIGKVCLRVSMPKPHKISKSPSACYEDAALQSKVKFCRVIRRWYPDGWHYLVQLILEGEPPRKVNPKTGELLHPIGKGPVGLDIGTQTLAAVGNKQVLLTVLADRVQDIQNKLRRINRAMDRSRRFANPGMFHPDGTIITKDKLPSNLLQNGRRKWVNSKRYDRLASERRSLLRQQAELRRQAHHELSNQLLAFGDSFFIEDMNFKALAKRSKKTERSAKTGKMKRKKRFGKSIANKAPALFVKILAATIEKQGGVLQTINTWKAKASQYNHEDKAYHKKSLSKRWNTMQDGRKIQRDLYSAFLIQHTNSTLDGFIQNEIEKDYESFMVLHNKEIQRLQGHLLPSSMGIR